jgi:hypothetical protein
MRSIVVARLALFAFTASGSASPADCGVAASEGRRLEEYRFEVR